MPRVTSPLRDTQIKQAKLKDREYSLADGNGLYLRVKPTGAKLWIYNYFHPITKKRKNISIGAYPDVPLADARQQRAAFKKLLAKGIDPKAYRIEQASQAKADYENTLQHISELWAAWKRPTVSPQTIDTAWARLDNHVLPYLGKKPIKDICIADVESTLIVLVKEEKLETTHRICGILKEVMEFAVIRKLIPYNHLSGISKLFPLPKVRNSPSIRPQELQQFLSDLNSASIRPLTKSLILWQLYTMVRPVEAATTRWDEIDLNKRIWTIPATKMKMRKDHVVYLSEQMVKLLESIKRMTPARDFLFPNQRNPKASASSQTANMVLKRIGYKDKLVAHGLRALATTTLYESGLFRSEVIEHSLAHVESNSVKAVYNRAEYEEERRRLTQWWSDHIENAMIPTEAKQGPIKVAGS